MSVSTAFVEVENWREGLDEVLTENEYVGTVNDWADDVDGGTESRRCQCESKQGQPKCVDTRCFNRATQTECDPEKCGRDCMNNRMQFMKYAKLTVVDMGPKGRGLVTKQDLKKGDLVYEYLGELINTAEYLRRFAEFDSQQHLFMLMLKEPKRDGSGGTYIDSTFKGGYSRFINHSCEPNCNMSVWTVGGKYRCAIFADKDIPVNTELTFDYAWDPPVTRPPTVCHCGTKSCRTFLEIFPSDDLGEGNSFRNGLWRPSADALLELAQWTPVPGEDRRTTLSKFLDKARIKVWLAERQDFQEAEVLVYDPSKKVYYVRYIQSRVIEGVDLSPDTAADAAADADADANDGTATDVDDDLDANVTDKIKQSKAGGPKWMWLDENKSELVIERKVIRMAVSAGKGDDDSVDGGGNRRATAASYSSTLQQSTPRVAPLRMKQTLPVRRSVRLSAQVANFMVENSRGDEYQHRSSDSGDGIVEAMKLLESRHYIKCFLEKTSPRQDTTISTPGTSSTEEELGLFGAQDSVAAAVAAVEKARLDFRIDSGKRVTSLMQDLAQRQGLALTNDWRQQMVPDATAKLNGLANATPRLADVARFQHVPQPCVSYPARTLPPSAGYDDVLCKPCGPTYSDHGDGRNALGAGLATRLRMDDHMRYVFGKLRAEGSFVGGEQTFSHSTLLHAAQLLQRALGFMSDVAQEKTAALTAACILLAVKSRGYFRVKMLRKVSLVAYCHVHGRDTKDKTVQAMVPSLQSRVLTAEAVVLQLLHHDIFVPDVFSVAAAAMDGSATDTSLEECAIVASGIATVTLTTWHTLLPELALCAAYLCLPVAMAVGAVGSSTRHLPDCARTVLHAAKQVFELSLNDVADATIFMAQRLPEVAKLLEKSGEAEEGAWGSAQWHTSITTTATDALLSSWIATYNNREAVPRHSTAAFEALDDKTRLRTRSPWLVVGGDKPRPCSGALPLGDTQLVRSLGKGSFVGLIPEQTLAQTTAAHVSNGMGTTRATDHRAVVGAFSLTPDAATQKMEDKRHRGMLGTSDPLARRGLEQLSLAAVTSQETLRELVILQQLHYTSTDGAHGAFGLPVSVARGLRPGSSLSTPAAATARTLSTIQLSSVSSSGGGGGGGGPSSALRAEDEAVDDEGDFLDAMLDSDDDGDDDDDEGDGGSEDMGVEGTSTAAKKSCRGLTPLSYIVIPGTQLYRPLHGLLPSSSHDPSTFVSASLARSLCLDVVSALDHCCRSGVYLGFICPEQCYVSTAGRLVLAGLAGATFSGAARSWTPGSSPSSSSSSSSEDMPEWLALSYTAPEVLCGGAPTAATTTFAAGALCALLLTGKPIVKAGSDAKKHMQYVYKTLGTPRKEGCSDVYAGLPLMARLGTAVVGPDGSKVEARSRLVKILSANVPKTMHQAGLPQKDPTAAPTGVATSLVAALGINPHKRPLLALWVQDEAWRSGQNDEPAGAVLRGVLAAQARQRLAKGDRASGSSATAAAADTAVKAAVDRVLLPDADGDKKRGRDRDSDSGGNGARDTGAWGAVSGAHSQDTNKKLRY